MHAIANIRPEYWRVVNKTLIDYLCDVLFKIHTTHLMKTFNENRSHFALLDKHHWNNTLLRR